MSNQLTSVNGGVSTWYAQDGSAYVMLVDPATGLPYKASGGGGGGSGFADLLYIDSTGQQFFYQDTGSALVSYKVQAGVYVPYTPVGTVTPFAADNVNVASSALPTGAATAANQPALNGDGGALAHVTNFPATQPVSATALPLPTGAATAANQPALNGDGGALSHVTNFPATQAVSGAVAVTANVPATDIQQSSGTIMSNGASVSLSIHGVSSVLVSVDGTFSGSIQVQGMEPDGSAWVPLNVAWGGPTNAYTTTAITTVSQGRVMLPAGFMQIRAIATAWTSGTAVVSFNASTGVGNVEAIQLNAANFNATVVNSGTFAVQNNAATPAGTNIIGKVGIDQTTYGTTNATFVGGESLIQVTPAVTSGSAYTTGNVIGGIMTIANPFQATALSGVLESISVAIKSTQASLTGLAVAIFKSSPTGTFTDKAAPAIATTDDPNLIGIFNLSLQTVSLGANLTQFQINNIGQVLVGSSNNLYCVLIATGTPTFTTTSDVVFNIGIMKD